MASILEGFLVRLGFDIDKDGMVKFNGTLAGATKRIRTFTKSAVAAGVALGAAFAKTTSSVNTLYKASNNTGASIRSMQTLSRTVERVGGNSEAVAESFNALAMNVKTYGQNFEALLKHQFGVELTDQNGKLRDMGEVFLELRNRLFEVSQVNPGFARQQAELIGLGAAFDDLMRKDFAAEFERERQAMAAWGTTLDDNAKKAHSFTNSLSRLWDTLAQGTKTLAMDILDTTGIDKWFDDFTKKVETGIPALNATIRKGIEGYINGDWTLWGTTKDVLTDRAVDTGLASGEGLEDYDATPEVEALLDQARKKREGHKYLTDKLADAYNAEHAKIQARYDAAGVTAPALPQTTRGLRNNNPGNLRAGPGAIGKDSAGFAQFASGVDGYRAMGEQLKAYNNAGLDNIASIIRKWAPASENNTEAYVASVLASMRKDLGDSLTATSRLDLSDTRVLDSLMDAMIDHENGAGASKYFEGSAYAAALQAAAQSNRVSKVVGASDKIASTTVSVNQTINVNGAQSPQAVADAVVKGTKETVNRYAGQNVV